MPDRPPDDPVRIPGPSPRLRVAAFVLAMAGLTLGALSVAVAAFQAGSTPGMLAVQTFITGVIWVIALAGTGIVCSLAPNLRSLLVVVVVSALVGSLGWYHSVRQARAHNERVEDPEERDPAVWNPFVW